MSFTLGSCVGAGAGEFSLRMPSDAELGFSGDAFTSYREPEPRSDDEKERPVSLTFGSCVGAGAGAGGSLSLTCADELGFSGGAFKFYREPKPRSDGEKEKPVPLAKKVKSVKSVIDKLIDGENGAAEKRRKIDKLIDDAIARVLQREEDERQKELAKGVLSQKRRADSSEQPSSGAGSQVLESSHKKARGDSSKKAEVIATQAEVIDEKQNEQAKLEKLALEAIERVHRQEKLEEELTLLCLQPKPTKTVPIAARKPISYVA